MDNKEIILIHNISDLINIVSSNDFILYIFRDHNILSINDNNILLNISINKINKNIIDLLSLINIHITDTIINIKNKIKKKKNKYVLSYDTTIINQKLINEIFLNYHYIFKIYFIYDDKNDNKVTLSFKSKNLYTINKNSSYVNDLSNIIYEKINEYMIDIFTNRLKEKFIINLKYMLDKENSKNAILL
jgi:hypothetical protein